MAQRKKIQQPQDNTPDCLVKPKAQFEAELNERIALGEEIIKKPIKDYSERSIIHTEYGFWHDYNAELIKRAFDRIDNQYLKDYNKALGFDISAIHRTPSFEEKIADLRGDINTYVNRLKKIREKLNLINEAPNVPAPQIDRKINAINNLSHLFSRFHKVAQDLRYRRTGRETIIIKDEYDVQDLLNSLLQISFDDIRPEDYSPSHAGGNSRVDFILNNEKIIVEVKMTNDNLRDKAIGEQLLVDIGRYRGRIDCNVLVVFVYDKLDHIRNKAGLISDLEGMSSPELKVRVFIEPK